jgi:hypothetical protein
LDAQKRSSNRWLAANRVIAAITLTIGLALLVGMFWIEIIARLF